MTLPKPYYRDRHCTIYNADCREILPQLQPVDLVLTDPPYSDYTHSNHLSGIKERRALGFESITADALVNVCKQLVSLSRGWVVLNCDWPFVAQLPDLVRFGVWVKPNAAPQFSGDRPGTGWEAIALLHRPGRKRWNGGGRHAVWTVPRVNGEHPTQKPLKLYRQLIADFLIDGRTILDPYMGSGTTLLAAKERGLHAVGIEVSAEHCDVAISRLRQEVLF